MVREFVRDTDGTDHAHDTEIYIPEFELKSIEFVREIGESMIGDNPTEQEVLAGFPDGTTCVETQEFTEFLS